MPGSEPGRRKWKEARRRIGRGEVVRRLGAVRASPGSRARQSGCQRDSNLARLWLGQAVAATMEATTHWHTTLPAGSQGKATGGNLTQDFGK